MNDMWRRGLTDTRSERWSRYPCEAERSGKQQAEHRSAHGQKTPDYAVVHTELMPEGGDERRSIRW